MDIRPRVDVHHRNSNERQGNMGITMMIDQTTHMLLCHSRKGGAIKQPICCRLILQSNAADMFTPIHIPRSNAHTQLLRCSEVTPVITDCLLEWHRRWNKRMGGHHQEWTHTIHATMYKVMWLETSLLCDHQNFGMETGNVTVRVAAVVNIGRGRGVWANQSEPPSGTTLEINNARLTDPTIL